MPKPIADLGRLQEVGRIRVGVKTGRAMKSIDTFRFTSADEELIEMLANRYGGEPRPWSDPKANPNNQFEVITDANVIDVVIAQGGVDSNYELFTGRGLQRQCDGETCAVQLWDGESVSTVTGPCLCEKEQVQQCKVVSRVSVMFPWLPFRGTWRLDTKSWNAANEFPSMMAILEQLREVRGLAEVELYISKESKIRNGRKAHYNVPKIRFKQSLLEMIEGKGVLGAELSGGATTMVELGSGSHKAESPYSNPDTQVVDAEVIE